MTRSKKFFIGLCVFISLFFAGSLWLKASTEVSLALQLQRLWIGALQGGKSCRLAQFAATPFFPPVYLSAVVMNPPPTQQPLLQMQIAKLNLARYRLYLLADLNSLALAKTLFGGNHIITINYECESLHDLFEINRARMQIQTLKRMLLAQERSASATSTIQPARVITASSFPTQTGNNHFQWESMSAKTRPKQVFAAAENVYICQGPWKGNNYSGQYVNGLCRLTYGGSIIEVKKFVILTHQNDVGQWVQSAAATKMKIKPIYGGFENGASMAICRVKVNEVFQVGKVVSGSICDVALANQEVSFQHYEILYPLSGIQTQGISPYPL